MTQYPIVTVDTTFVTSSDIYESTTIETNPNLTEPVTKPYHEITSEKELIASELTEKTDIFSTSEYTTENTESTINVKTDQTTFTTNIGSSLPIEPIHETTVQFEEPSTVILTKPATSTMIHLEEITSSTMSSSLPTDITTSTIVTEKETTSTTEGGATTSGKPTSSSTEEIEVTTNTGREFPSNSTQTSNKTDLTDCSQEGNECHNGGTCILEEKGYKVDC